MGTGSYLPTRLITNTDLEKTLDTTHAWIVERTGICQRYLVGEGESTASMAVMAARRALEAAQLKTVDMIIVATTTPDAFFPSTACLVQAELNLLGCPAFDIAAACAGFNYALGIADQFIRTGQIKTVLVIGSETMSRVLDWQDRSTCILFGDGAGAVVLSASTTPGILGSQLHADGTHQDLLYINNFRLPDPRILKMDGAAVFRHAVNKMGDTLLTSLMQHKIHIEQLDWLIPHQANLRIIRLLAKKLKLPESRVVVTIDQQANTSSASVPLALDTAVRDGRIQPGHLLLLESFGGGFVWGSTLMRY